MNRRTRSRSRSRFCPSLENLETILCLDATLLTVDPTDIIPTAAVLAQANLDNTPPGGLSPTGTIPTGQQIQDITNNANQGTTTTFQQGLDNLNNQAQQFGAQLVGPEPDPAPGPIVLNQPVTIVPDPVGPLAPAPILPLAPPTTPVPTPQPQPCLVNSCPDGAAPITYNLYGNPYGIPYYFNRAEVMA